MKTICSAVSVTLVVLSVSLGQAASKPKDNSPAASAHIVFEQMASWSGSIEEVADQIATAATYPDVSGGQLNRLHALKDDVNIIGRELQSLQGEWGTLPEWERRAFDEVLPLMQEIAANTTKEIDDYNSSRHHLWTTSFNQEAAKIFEDAGQAKEALDGYLKLATVREQGLRTESTRDSNR
jgi:hypothetical protein